MLLEKELLELKNNLEKLSHVIKSALVAGKENDLFYTCNKDNAQLPTEIIGTSNSLAQSLRYTS